MQAADFPIDWPGDYIELVRPKSRSLTLSMTKEPYDLEKATRLAYGVKFLASHLHKTKQKVGGYHLYQLEEMQKIFGIADGLIPKDTPFGGRFVPTVYEAFSLLDPSLFQLTSVEPDQDRQILVVGDSVDGILYANLIHAQMSKVPIEWLVVREHVGFEGTIRNYFNHSDAAYAYKSERCLIVNPEDSQHYEVVEDILERFPQLVKVIFLNATGSEVLENNFSIDSYSTVTRALNWLDVGKTMCSQVLKKGGNMVVRINLFGLTRQDSLRALCDLVKLFEECKLVAPALGVDNGIIYVILEGFIDNPLKTSSNNASHSNSEDDDPLMSPDVFGFLCELVPFIQESVIAHVLFLDSLLGLFNMNQNKLKELGEALRSMRDKDSSYKPPQMDTLNRVMKFMLGQYFKTRSILLNWHNEESMPNEIWIKPPPFFEQIETDKKSIHVDVYRAIRSAKGNRNLGLEIMRQQRKMRIEHWDYKELPYIPLGQACVTMEWLDIEKVKDKSKYTVIWGSRWCLSSLVPVRAAFKTILMENHSKKHLNKSYRRCFECHLFDKIKLKVIRTLANKVKGGSSPPNHDEILRLFEMDESSFEFACFVEDYLSFVTKTDQECAYERAMHMMTVLENLSPHGSAYICNFPILTRIDAGVVFLLTSLFENVYLVGCNFKPVTFGILFYSLSDKTDIKDAIIEHVRACIMAEKTELVNFEKLDCFFGLAYLNQWNSHVIGQAIRVQEENLYNAE